MQIQFSSVEGREFKSLFLHSVVEGCAPQTGNNTNGLYSFIHKYTRLFICCGQLELVISVSIFQKLHITIIMHECKDGMGRAQTTYSCHNTARDKPTGIILRICCLLRLQNDLYCVGCGVNSTHSLTCAFCYSNHSEICKATSFIITA